jgi:hypothetical protein
MIQFPPRESKLQKPIHLLKVKDIFNLTIKSEDFDKRDDIEIYLNETEKNRLLKSKVGNKSSDIKGYSVNQVKDIYKKLFNKNVSLDIKKNEIIEIIIKEIDEIMKHRNKSKQNVIINETNVVEGYGDRYYDEDDY